MKREEVETQKQKLHEVKNAREWGDRTCGRNYEDGGSAKDDESGECHAKGIESAGAGGEASERDGSCWC